MIREPRPGRLAFLCVHKDHDGRAVPLRVFAADPSAPVPECPAHGKMTLQENVPYHGQPIPVP